MDNLFSQVDVRIIELAKSHHERTHDATILHEIQERLKSLHPKYVKLMELNDQLCALDPLAMDIKLDPASDQILVRMGGMDVARIKLNRADFDVSVQMSELYSGGSFTPGKRTKEDSPELKEVEAELITNLEQFYHEAHRVMKLIPKLSSAKKTKIGGAGLVRNLLIEHPPDGELYTFGWSNNGPRVKPVSRGTLKHNDEGLTPNTKELLTEILRCLC